MKCSHSPSCILYVRCEPSLIRLITIRLLVQDQMQVSCLGVALRQIIPNIVGEGLSSWWELVKPLVEFRWEVILTRLNSMFELATQEEVNNAAPRTEQFS